MKVPEQRRRCKGHPCCWLRVYVGVRGVKKVPSNLTINTKTRWKLPPVVILLNDKVRPETLFKHYLSSERKLKKSTNIYTVPSISVLLQWFQRHWKLRDLKIRFTLWIIRNNLLIVELSSTSSPLSPNCEESFNLSSIDCVSLHCIYTVILYIIHWVLIDFNSLRCSDYLQAIPY